MSRRFHPLRARAVLVALLTLWCWALLACGGASEEEVSAADRAEIRDLLERYLPKLGEAYETGNLEVLRDVAAEKEIASLYKRINDLMEQEGRVVHPKLVSFEIEDITVWNYSNAFVTTLEVWDLAVLASGTDQVTSRVEGQRSRVKYQVKRRDDDWQVLYRTVVATFE